MSTYSPSIKRQLDELEFPAAAKVLESPPSPAGRIAAVSICALLHRRPG